MKKFVTGIWAMVLGFSVIGIMGCSGEGPDAGGTNSGETSTTAINSPTKDDHSGWWCPEHAIPEEVCSMCSAQAAADFKEKGDWCEEHQRAESQCFICDPSRAEKFAKLYEAKYGTAPPAPRE